MYLQIQVQLDFLVFIVSKIVFFDVLVQRVTEAETARHKVQAEQWVYKTFSAVSMEVIDGTRPRHSSGG
jgi:hypothetical protein